MRFTRMLIAAGMLSAHTVAIGQGFPPYAMPSDPRIQQIEYRPGMVIPLRVSPGYQLTVGFAPDERIESVAVGDSSGWQVIANKRGDYLFVKPVGDAPPTNMTVVTDFEAYSFDLSIGEGGAPYLVRVLSAPPTPMESVAQPVRVEPGRYKLSGVKTLRPSAISDDGRQTFIEWPSSATLPAVYGIGEDGREFLTNGEMIGGRFVLDAIYPVLVFRLDKDIARAKRLKTRAAKMPR